MPLLDSMEKGLVITATGVFLVVLSLMTYGKLRQQENYSLQLTKSPVAAWEVLDSGSESCTTRLRVPGGWVYREQFWCQTERSCSLCFVPDVAPERS